MTPGAFSSTKPAGPDTSTPATLGIVLATCCVASCHAGRTFVPSTSSAAETGAKGADTAPRATFPAVSRMPGACGVGADTVGPVEGARGFPIAARPRAKDGSKKGSSGAVMPS